MYVSILQVAKDRHQLTAPRTMDPTATKTTTNEPLLSRYHMMIAHIILRNIYLVLTFT